MRYILALILIFAIIPDSLTAQPVSVDPETSSYMWYSNAQWDSLLIHRRELLHAAGKNDYYYLRYRLGEAAFRKQDFRQATTDFRRAVELNSADTFSLRFLENCFVETGESYNALIQGNRLQKLGANSQQRYKQITGNFAYLEAGIKFSSDRSQIGNLQYYHAGIHLQVAPCAGLFTSLSQLKQINYFGPILQNIFYSRAHFQLAKGWSLQPFFSYLDVTIEFSEFTRYFQNQVVGLNTVKSAGHFDFNIQPSYSNLNGEDQYQVVLGSTWYPYGNNRLGFNAQLYLHQNNGKNNLLGKASTSVKLLKNAWINCELYAGNALNVVENAGYLVNNALDLTRWRANATFSYFPHRKVGVFLVYQHEARQEFVYKFDYTLNSLFAGLKLMPFN